MSEILTEHLRIDLTRGLIRLNDGYELGSVTLEGEKERRITLEVPDPFREEALRGVTDECFLRGCSRVYGDWEKERGDWFPPAWTEPFTDVNLLEGGAVDLLCTSIDFGSADRSMVPEYQFDVVLGGRCLLVGRINLRLGFNPRLYYGGNIGYGISREQRGHGYAAAACRALMPLLRRHGLSRVLISCRPENGPSRRTIEAVGGKLVRYAQIPPDHDLYQAEAHVACIYGVDVAGE